MKLLLIAFLFAASSTALAMHISVSDEQPITAYDQLSSFTFAELPTSGTSGHFTITLNGDYSGFDIESAVVTLDVASGSLDIGDGSQPNGVVSNTIGGLTLSSYSVTAYHFDDTEQSWVFDISESLLGSLLADGLLTVAVQNDSYVSPFSRSNPDFVRVGFSFNVNQVPEPATLALLSLGLAGFGVSRLRTSK